MAVMSGGEALVKSLAGEGVDVVFGIPGIQIYGIVSALREAPDIRLISTRHEQATTYMADGYARRVGEARGGSGRSGRRALQRGLRPDERLLPLHARAADRGANPARPESARTWARCTRSPTKGARCAR